MEIFIARQPIFDKKEKVKAYELLYRDSENPYRAVITDADTATRNLVANAMTVFDIQRLANYNRAFINFGYELIMNDFVRTLVPEQVVIDLDDSVIYNENVIDKIREYKLLGYKFAIKDRVGDKTFDKILPLIDVLVVDIRGLSENDLRRISAKYKHSNLTLLAQKIETREEFELIKQLDFDYCQGFFFEKPMLIKDKSVDTSRLNYFRLINEVNKPEIDFQKVAGIIKRDTALTYQLFKTLNKVSFARIHRTKDIMDCIVRLGEEKLRNWLLLIITRRFNKGKSDEFAKHAYIRGMFMEELMKECKVPSLRKKHRDGYLIGMFSMLPMIADMDMDMILADLDLETEIEEALLGIKDNELKLMLDLVKYYENAISEKPDIDIGLDNGVIAKLYTECIFAGDVAFRTLS